MKKTVAVLFGGESTEHEVSRRSAMTVYTNIPEEYEKRLIGIDKAGVWYSYEGDESLVAGGEWEGVSKEFKKPLFFDPAGFLFTLEEGKKIPYRADVFFPVLHGKNGEDGTVQGLFELLGVPYVGCGVAASANGMDKSMTKRLVESLGIRQAKYVFVDRRCAKEIERIKDEVKEKLGYPVFIKPCRSGSSVGVVKAADEKELLAGLDSALSFDDRILVEEAIDARELECAVLETDEGTVAEVGEVVAAATYYDYDAKYNSNASKTEIHPDVPAAVEEEIKRDAVAIFNLLDCRGLSRVDFFIDRKTGGVVFNEINTLPGFTVISMYPMLMEKHGISKKELAGKLIRDAFKRYKEKT